MSRNDAFVGLSEFLAVARCGSFRRAARGLGVTPGAVSQAVQALERRLGAPLFSRTTRSVALTEAGERLFAQVAPAAGAIAEAIDDLRQDGEAPGGTLKLMVQRFALAEVVAPALAAFRRTWPEVRLEISVGEDPAGLVAGGHDAGLRIGEFIDRDMLAVRISPPFRWGVYATPGYLARHGRPQTPEDLARHSCLRFRRRNIGDIYRWEFSRDGRPLAIDPPGAVVADDAGLVRNLGLEGVGLFYTASLLVADEVASGRLEPLLETFTPAEDALFVYYPRSGRAQPKLRAFVETCRARLA